MSNCATCKHALPVDEFSSWNKMGFAYQEYRHCSLDRYWSAHVIRAERGCAYQPSKWEPITEEKAA